MYTRDSRRCQTAWKVIGKNSLQELRGCGILPEDEGKVTIANLLICSTVATKPSISFNYLCHEYRIAVSVLACPQ